MLKKFLLFSSFILLFTIISAFIYALIIYNTESDKLFNIITLLIGACFFFLIGILTRFITSKRFLIYALLAFLIVSLIIFIIKTLAFKETPLILSYKHLINLFSTILGALLFKKKKV